MTNRVTGFSPILQGVLLYGGSILHMNPNIIAHSVVWIDPCQDDGNIRLANVQNLASRIEHDFTERIPVEAVAIIGVIHIFMTSMKTRNTNICVLSR